MVIKPFADLSSLGDDMAVLSCHAGIIVTIQGWASR